MPALLLRYPAFFRVEGSGRDRVHEGWPLLAPELEAQGPSAEAVTARLLHLVRETIEDERTLGMALSAIPDTGEERVGSFEISARAGRGTRSLRYVLVAREGQLWSVFPRLTPAVLPLPMGTDPAYAGVALQDALDAYVRREKPDAERLATWDDQPGDRVIWLEQRVDVRWSPIEPDLGSLFARLGAGGPKAMVGAVELRKVATSLKRLYPERLLRERVPQPLTGELAEALFTSEPSGLVLLGAPGSGRSTLIHAALHRQLDAAHRAHGPDTATVPDIWHLDPLRIVSGQSVVGAWQRRFQAILCHIAAPSVHRSRPDVLWIDNPVALASVGRARGSDLTLARMLRPWLEQRRLPVVIEATPEGWARLEELDRPLTDLFRVIRLGARTRDEARRLVVSNLPALEAETGATLSLAALHELILLAERQTGDRVLPGAAMDVLHPLARQRQRRLEIADIRRAYAEESGLREEWLDQEHTRLDPVDLRGRVEARLAGQPAAVDFIVRCLLTIRAGLQRPGRPVASALLVGPTGVGKTETARVLADLLFAREGHLLRFDMNELVDDGALHRLLGDLDTEGLLTSRVRHRPVSVVLLDEVEKAHPAVRDLLLQVLDEGRLTDGRGQRADFQRCVVLMTSNVGAAELARAPGFERHAADLARSYRAAAERAFRPELINRIDQIIAFSSLSAEDLRVVALSQVRALLRREGFRRRTVFLDLVPAALDRLASAAAGSTGARALKRSIEREIAGPLATVLLDHPPELPLLISLPATGPLEVFVLPFASRRMDPSLERAPSSDALHRALEGQLPTHALVASAGPLGTTLHRSALAQHIQARLFGEGDDDDPGESGEGGFPLTDAQLLRASGRRGNGWWTPFRPDWTAAQSFRTVRAYLLATLDEPRVAAAPETDPVPAAARAIAAMQLSVLAARGETTVLLRARGLASPPADLWRRARCWVDHVDQLLSQAGARITSWGRAPQGWMEDHRPTGAEERLIRATGAGLDVLLAAEVGVHVLWLDDEPALAIQVALSPEGPVEDQPWPEPAEIVRLYVGRTEGSEVVIQRATDLRLERVWERMADLTADGIAPWALEAL